MINPANEELIGHISSGTKDDINKAVLAASNAFKTYQFTSKEDRIELLNNIISEYENRYDDLVQTITEEMGAPVWLSQKAQASTGIKNLHETLDALKDYEFEKRVNPETVVWERPATDYWVELLKNFLKNHYENTKSNHSKYILENFDNEIDYFFQICPKEMLDKLKHPISNKKIIDFAS